MVKKLLLITLSIAAFKAYSGPGLRVCKMSFDTAVKIAAANAAKNVAARQLPALSIPRPLQQQKTTGGLRVLVSNLNKDKATK